MHSWLLKLSFLFPFFFWGGGVTQKNLPLLGGAMGKNLLIEGAMQLLNDSSKIPPAPPYLVKNERSLITKKLMQKVIKSYSCDEQREQR